MLLQVLQKAQPESERSQTSRSAKRRVDYPLKKEREEILGGEIKLAKKIKRGKVCAGCGVIFRGKGDEEYCKACRKKVITWGLE